MSTHNFTMEDLALALIEHLDRRNIFPPTLNDPETFLPKIDESADLSISRPKKSPHAFLICRSNVQEEASRKGTYNMRVISKATGILWKNASSEEKGIYKQIADRVNVLHCRRTSTIIYKK